ncbi:PrpF domain-containing protein [Kutzneria buriramensis]|uniref:4-oxalomesaconate tautomerase n=1 Tax=Kutzneria buriramensis TaxID=1045776 RepID=A0A3E0GZ56_9PSEU|nr:PrpF domain-containing protein [Kutzneria buriramensis]REH33087.1 4-oxalomesaconate tautomerase [Kutzneria buriramensis]
MAGVPCMLMRGGTSKGAYFLASDLPVDRERRDDLLLRIMGSGDPRQIDGIGGATPLTSKVAVVSPGTEPGADVDYLFLQLGVEERTVTDRQNCGNLLAGVGPFAVERGLVPAGKPVRIRMVNSGSVATARFPTEGAAISGVPGTAPGVVLDFEDTEGPRGVLPTGNTVDTIGGVRVTCVDNGMPVVVAWAEDLGITGYETVEELAENAELTNRIQEMRLGAAELMGLDDTTSVPKTTLIAPPRDGGTVCTRTFIPLAPHTAIGVLGAVSVATALMIEGTTGHVLTGRKARVDVEHPTGHLQVEVELDETGRVRRSGVLRTARKLFDGKVFPR